MAWQRIAITEFSDQETTVEYFGL